MITIPRRDGHHPSGGHRRRCGHRMHRKSRAARKALARYPKRNPSAQTQRAAPLTGAAAAQAQAARATQVTTP